MIYVIATLSLILVFLLIEFLASLVGKKYMGHWPRLQVQTIWTWAHYSWNYIGARDWKANDRTPVRHIGVRWFGHEWEQQIEIPMGELRF